MVEFPDRQLTNDDLPSLFAAADAASLRGQRRYVRGVTWRSWLAVLAAVCGVATWRVGGRDLDILALLTMIALVALLAVEMRLQRGRPDSAWYDGRAIAESTKSLTWRYAVRGAPFEEVDAHQARRFTGELARLLHDVKFDSVVPTARPAVSAAVSSLRSSHLEVRKAVYIRDRVVNQHTWYAKKAGFNQKRADAWGVALIAVEVAGVVAAGLKLVGWIEFDLAGVVAALIGVGATRLGVRQYTTNARAYSIASEELAIVRSRLEEFDCGTPDSERIWAAEVADAEEAVSREHTMWRASRSQSE